MKIDYMGKVVVITGAGGALGSRMAMRFAENGAVVACCDLTKELAEQTAEAIGKAGGNAFAVQHDVTRNNEKAMAEIAEKCGEIHLLVNNAGVNVPPEKRAYIDKFDDDVWERIVSVDLDGVYHCSKQALAYMKTGAAILNISSVVGLVPFRNQCAFAAAKAGVINLTRAMALELGERGIRVNAIAPGSIAMEGTQALIYGNEERTRAMLSQIPLGHPGEPDDIAYGALYVCSREAGYMTGSVLTIDGGWTCGYARNF